MGSIRSLFARTPGIGWAVVGLACALMVLEVQRMPVARFVSFSMFAPLPYAVEAAAMLAIVVLYRVRGALRVSDLRAVRVTVALLSAAATWLLLYSPLADDGLALAALVLYRVATGLLLVLWGERLVPLGARRTACAFAAACLLSGLLTMVLALFSGEVARVLLGALPVAAGGLFVLYRPLVGKRRANDELDQPLPRFACSTLKDRVVAVSLVALPLLCRGPMVTSQSSWMGLQGDAVMAAFIQVAIGCGIVAAGLIALLVVKRVWNRSFILVYELFVLPVTFVSFYTSQASGDLWFLHMLIVDSTYKATLFYVMMTPFLFPKGARKGNSSTPLLCSFAFMIAIRALFVGLHASLSASLYASLTVVVVLATFAAGGALSFLIMQRQATRREAGEAAAAEAVRAGLEERCAAVAARFDLTPREREVLVLLAQNYRAPYIAEKLVVSQSTVKTHMHRLASAGEGFQHELGAGADGGFVLREETGDVGDGQQERLDELRRLRLRVGHLLHLGEHDVHGFVGETGGRVARLRQRVERGRVGIGAQGVARFLAEFAVDAGCEVLARLHEAGRERDAPAVQRIAKLADEQQLSRRGLWHDAHGVGRARPTCGIAFQLGAVGFEALARRAFVLVRRAVGHSVGQHVLLDPSVGNLADVGKLGNGLHGKAPVLGCGCVTAWFWLPCVRIERTSQARVMPCVS